LPRNLPIRTKAINAKAHQTSPPRSPPISQPTRLHASQHDRPKDAANVSLPSLYTCQRTSPFGETVSGSAAVGGGGFYWPDPTVSTR
jgi:hypothetical protein